jgi:diguanylate cyclase (GGDEF)-like protein
MKSEKKEPIIEKNMQLSDAIHRLREDLRSFISLSMRESDASWEQWISVVKKETKEIKARCWEKKKCAKTDCPAFKHSCHRCWLIAGTMCGDKPIGKFAQKYKSCVECNVYLDEVLADPVTEVYEHLITLIYSLRNSKNELKTLALNDRLTGLYNRNYFDLIIEREIKRIKRYGGGFTVFMIDIDNFKFINDTYGHVHGDCVLREFAQILRNSVREADLLFRYGGDEFLIIRHGASDAADNRMIDRIQERFMKWNREYESENYKLTFSYGSSVFDKKKDFKKVIAEADSEMYRNKEFNKRRNGRHKRG